METFRLIGWAKKHLGSNFKEQILWKSSELIQSRIGQLAEGSGADRQVYGLLKSLLTAHIFSFSKMYLYVCCHHTPELNNLSTFHFLAFHFLVVTLTKTEIQTLSVATCCVSTGQGSIYRHSNERKWMLFVLLCIQDNLGQKVKVRTLMLLWVTFSFLLCNCICINKCLCIFQKRCSSLQEPRFCFERGMELCWKDSQRSTAPCPPSGPGETAPEPGRSRLRLMLSTRYFDRRSLARASPPSSSGRRRALPSQLYDEPSVHHTLNRRLCFCY